MRTSDPGLRFILVGSYLYRDPRRIRVLIDDGPSQGRNFGLFINLMFITLIQFRFSPK